VDFSKIASEYDRKAVVQASAGQRLLSLLTIKDHEDVLDIGCGTGAITAEIRQMTRGRVVAIDSEVEMIRQAVQRFGGRGIQFECLPAEEMTFREEFDAIFCNSAFQWFSSPEEVLRRCYEALRPGGRVGVQAPAKENYCPNFIEAVERVRDDPATSGTFRHFRSPWFFLETEEDYRTVFEKTGFSVQYVEIRQTRTEHSPEEVFRIFDSGASAGYLNQRYYDVPVSKDYIQRFIEIVKDAFHSQAGTGGKVKLVFNRVYVIASRPLR